MCNLEFLRPGPNSHVDAINLLDGCQLTPKAQLKKKKVRIQMQYKMKCVGSSRQTHRIDDLTRGEGNGHSYDVFDFDGAAKNCEFALSPIN